MQSSVDEDDEPVSTLNDSSVKMILVQFYNDDDSDADISIPLDTSMN